MMGMASQMEMTTFHLQIEPPSCSSTPLKRTDDIGISLRNTHLAAIAHSRSGHMGEGWGLNANRL